MVAYGSIALLNNFDATHSRNVHRHRLTLNQYLHVYAS